MTPEKPSLQTLVRHAFVLQASLAFDAREIKHQLPRDKRRLAPHLKTIRDRDIQWLESIISNLPALISAVSASDKGLANAFKEQKAESLLNEQLGILKQLAGELQAVINGSDDIRQAMDDCDRLQETSTPLSPLFSQAKDALGVKKARGVI